MKTGTYPTAAQRTMTRQIRCAWEIYAVTELGMSAGEAIRAFDKWRDDLAAVQPA
jgi:DNA-binding HxlR family transcriptional regulator